MGLFDEVVGMFGNKRNGALLALTQTFRNVRQFITQIHGNIMAE